MVKLLRVELEKLLYSRLLYAVAGLFIFYTVVMLAAFSSMMNTFGSGNAGQPSGAVFTYISFAFSFYPFLATVAIVFAAVSVSQELRSGTLRYNLLAPFARWKLLSVKFLVVVLSITLVTLFLFLCISGIATVFLGQGNVVTIDLWRIAKAGPRGETLLNFEETLQRCLTALPFVVYAAVANASFAFLLSTLVGSPVLAITIPLSLFFISSMIQFSPFLPTVKPYLPTRQMFFWDEIFARDIPWDKVYEGLSFNGLLIAVCLLTALVVFSLRDVTS